MRAYAPYREAMRSTAVARGWLAPPCVPRQARQPCRAIVRYYGCYEYLHRIGLLNDGTLEYYEDKPRVPSVSEIQTEVAAHFNIPAQEMTSARRAREVARPRQVAMYLSKTLTPQSLPEIGRRFGDRDHTTVIHAVRQIEKLRAVDAELDDGIAALACKLSSPGIGRRG